MIQRHALLIPAPARSNLTSVYVRFDSLGGGSLNILVGGGTLLEVTGLPVVTDAVAILDFRTERLLPGMARVITTATISFPGQPSMTIPNYSEVRIANAAEAALVTDFITDNVNVHRVETIGSQ